MGEPTGQRNGYGFKDSADCWRTVDGVRWPQWRIDPSDTIMKAYRAAGVRARRIKHPGGSSDAFVHPDDHEKAAAVDREVEPMFG